MFKSILAAVKPASTQKYVIDYAVELAARVGAELSVCTVIDRWRISPPEPMPIGAGSFKVDRDAERMKRAESEAAALLEAGRAASSAAGIECRVERLEGEVVEMLTRRTHEVDLLVVGDTTADDGGDESLIVRALKHAGRPTIVVPRRPLLGNETVVAYDGSLQAARAMASFAYSGLGVGRKVHVVSCDADAAAATKQAEVACRFLQRHGLAAQPEPATIAPITAIRAAIADHSAGLLVMGMFGNSPVREFLLGSATRSILQDLPTAAFLDR